MGKRKGKRGGGKKQHTCLHVHIGPMLLSGIRINTAESVDAVMPRFHNFTDCGTDTGARAVTGVGVSVGAGMSTGRESPVRPGAAAKSGAAAGIDARIDLRMGAGAYCGGEAGEDVGVKAGGKISVGLGARIGARETAVAMLPKQHMIFAVSQSE